MKRTLGIFRLFSVILLVSTPFAGAQEKPYNVLFLAIDDLNTWPLSEPHRYGGQVAAPNIRKLADEGVIFMRNYCASPKCSPSRTAVLSGVAPWVSGVYQNSQTPDNSEVLQKAIELRSHFQDNGYYVVSSGKIGHGWKTGFKPDAPDSGRGTRDPVPPNAPLSPSSRGGEQDWGPIHIPEEEMNDTKQADFAIAELQKKHDKPFFIACGMFHPHMPWYVPQKYLDMYPLDSIVAPPIKEGDLDDMPERGRALALDRTEVYENAVEHGVYKNALRGYLASTTYVDAQMGRVLDALEASPYKDNTIVILWSDHGFHVGEKFHWQKGTLWEEGTHSLLMMKVPGMTQPKQVCEQIVSLLDLYPTLNELCGLPDPPQTLSGKSLVPLLKDPDHPWDNAAISGYTFQKPDLDETDVFLSVRTPDYRYISYGDGTEEFYHRTKDPNEWTNEAGNPEYQEQIERHRALLPDPMKPTPAKVRSKK
ncbi:MAG: sulfatase [Verrucomicrobiota bacterium]